jgi:sugar lactone lactonase YvrE
MATWGNKDTGNNKPTFPVEMQVRGVAVLTTNGAVATGNTIVFTTTIPSSITAGAFVYSLDANNSVSRMLDGSIVRSNDVSFFRSNNTVRTIDSANSTVRLTNNVMATLATGSTVYFANAIIFKANSVLSTYHADTILVTATRAANANVAIAKSGNFSVGWVHVRRKTNNDGTIRYLKETLVALANGSASNTSSGNTSFGQIVSGL